MAWRSLAAPISSACTYKGRSLEKNALFSAAEARSDVRKDLGRGECGVGRLSNKGPAGGSSEVMQYIKVQLRDKVSQNSFPEIILLACQ